MDELALDVAGMSCGHCAAAVKHEVGKVPGVTRVDVDLGAKRVTVAGTEIDRDTVVAAIDEAGYSIARP